MIFRAADKAVRLAAGATGADSLPDGMPGFSARDRELFEEFFNRPDVTAARGLGIVPGQPRFPAGLRVS